MRPAGRSWVSEFGILLRMAVTSRIAAAVGAAILLAGCSFTDQALLPALGLTSGTKPSAPAATPAVPSSDGGAPAGGSLASLAHAVPGAPPAPPGSGIATGRPLVVIRFDRPDPAYRQALHQAVSQALERRPSVAFDLVGVAPAAAADAAARRDAEEVLRALTDMGLPPERVSLSTMTSDRAETDEVHLYVR